MPVQTKIDQEKDLTIHIARGLLTDEQMFEAQNKFYNDHPTRLELWDMSDTDMSLITIQGMRRYIDNDARLGSARKNGKCAIVVVKTLQFGMARMAETFAELAGLPFRVRIFKSIDEAMAWLTESSEE